MAQQKPELIWAGGIAASPLVILGSLKSSAAQRTRALRRGAVGGSLLGTIFGTVIVVEDARTGNCKDTPEFTAVFSAIGIGLGTMIGYAGSLIWDHLRRNKK